MNPSASNYFISSGLGNKNDLSTEDKAKPEFTQVVAIAKQL